jgi:hypothetical protein
MNFSQINKSLSLSRLLLATFLLLFIKTSELKAQATLSVQGIVKKSNGVALEDGEYPITFKLYVVDSTQVKWMETIPNVELISGIYSVVLGKITPLTLAFNKDYELGVSIGTQEMLPRIKLTSAPYALSLRGQSNQFPSTGLVLADNLKVAQGVLARGGTPGLSGVNNNGYSFNGWSDTGLYSTGYGKVSLFCNNTEIMEVTSNGTTTNGTATSTAVGTNLLNLYNNGGINYSSTQGSFQGWRLADVDDLGSHDGWKSYSPNGQNTGWNNPTVAGDPCLCNGGTFVGNMLEPSVNNQVLKKKFDVAGSWTQMKVKFRYYFLDSWGFGGGDMAFAGFATEANGSQFKVGWAFMGQYLQANGNFNNTTAVNANNIGSSGSVYSDYWMDVEMTARRNGGSNEFWVFIGAALDEDTNNETYAIGSVEIWVK